MDTMPVSDTNDCIDRRIVKQEYRNYDLVARYWEYGYLGKIWKYRKAVEEVDAEGDEGIDELVTRMKGRVDEIIGECLRARGDHPPSEEELSAALARISSKLTETDRILLKAHAESPGGVIDMAGLQKLGGHNSPSAVLMSYSNIARRLCDEIPWVPRETPGSYPCLRPLLKRLPTGRGSLTLKKDALNAILAVNNNEIVR